MHWSWEKPTTTQANPVSVGTWTFATRKLDVAYRVSAKMLKGVTARQVTTKQQSGKSTKEIITESTHKRQKERQQNRPLMKGGATKGELNVTQKKLTPRQTAKANGEKHYEGGKCGRCGGTKRYVVSAACINCTYLSKEERAKEPLVRVKKQKTYVRKEGVARPAVDVRQEERNFAEVIKRVYERQSRW